MIDNLLFYTHHTLSLMWGVLLSAAFCGVRPAGKNALRLGGIFLLCAALQVITLLLLGEEAVWKLYPLIVHVPLGVMLWRFFRKRGSTVLAAVTLAYLCCQPSNWFGMLTDALIASPTAEWCVRIVVALVVTFLALRYLSGYIAELFSKDTRSVLIFAIVPMAYYLFDYTAGIYTNLWTSHTRLMAEFLACFLCLAFMVFCVVYYREYERKMQIQRHNQIVEITVTQQAKEIAAIRQSNMETSLLRHDMRHLLSSIALSIESGDRESALKLITGYTSQVEATALHRYCNNDILNYILTNFEEKCQKAETAFQADLEFAELPVDETMFSSVLSNALENALNAQLPLPREKRKVKLMLKESDGKLLLSVKNPYAGAVTFDPATQIPVSREKGHGFGTQSILYLTEKMGGKCQFSVQNGMKK